MRKKSVLGIDFGERRLGLALSAAGTRLASGWGTVDTRASDIWRTLSDLVREEDVGTVVVGYPLRTDTGLPGEKARRIDDFIGELERRFGLPVHREDESHTSQLAQEALRARGTPSPFSPGAPKSKGRKARERRRSAKADIDRLAACFILQDWLDRSENEARRPGDPDPAPRSAVP